MDSTHPSQTTDGVTSYGLLIHRFLEAQRKAGPLLLWAGVVGAGAGAIGGIYRLTIERLQSLHSTFIHQLPGDWAWVAAGGISGVLVVASVWLVRTFAPEAGGSGIQEVEGALDGVRPLRWQRLLPVKFFGGLLSLGAGLVLGREGPTIQMGANSGKMLGDLLRREPDAVHVLVASGAGAGLTAAFNAPMAGVLFVIEEMRPQFRYSVLSVQCVIAACAVSDFVVRVITGGAVDVAMRIVPEPPSHHLWAFVVLGVIFGFLGAAFNAALVVGVDTVARLRTAGALGVAFVVGGAVGVLGWLDVDLIWDGHSVIEQTLRGALPLGTMVMLVAGRFGTTVGSYSSGAPGGIFAPMLALGTLVGVTFGQVLATSFSSPVPPDVFAVAGMGALFAASVRAPLTGMLLAVELTANYAQFLPLMLTCVSATIVAHGLGARPIYTVLLERLLARTGQHEDAVREAGTSP